MQLTQKNNPPTVSSDCSIERRPFAMAQKFLLDPASSQLAAEEEGERRAGNVAGQIENESPPKSEEKPAPHCQNAAGQQQDVAGCVKQRIKNAAPDIHFADRSLRMIEIFPHGEISHEPGDEKSGQ
jgi:hypothetical protein